MSNRVRTPDAWTEALGSYLDRLSAARAPRGTIYLRSYQLRTLATRTGLAPEQHTTDTLESHLGSLEVADNTARSIRTTLRSFYTWMHRTGRMPHNPAADLPVIHAARGRPRPAPDHVVTASGDHPDPRIRLMLQLAGYAGLRCREIARVHTDDVRPDLLGWTLTVHGKGKKTRDVPLRDEIAKAILALPRGYAFPGQIDGHLSDAYVSKLISRALPPGITAHQFRHWFGSQTYITSGKDIRAVQELLGHASVATTQIYTAVPDDTLRAAVDGLAA